MNLQTFLFNFFRVHTMVAWLDGRSDCIVVDPGDCVEAEHAKLYQFLDSHNLKPAAILLTHGHPDHIFGVQGLLDRYGCTVYMSADDDATLAFSADTADKLGMGLLRTDFPYTDARDGARIREAGMEFTVIATPGHSPGGLSWYEEKEGVLFSGTPSSAVPSAGPIIPAAAWRTRFVPSGTNCFRSPRTRWCIRDTDSPPPSVTKSRPIRCWETTI